MMTRYRFILLLFVLEIACLPAYSTIIHVPGSYPQIQSAINASISGDTILVDPGVYYENINFNGKNILLASHYLFTKNTADIIATVINGSTPSNPDIASCVRIISGETSSAILEGFTITKGKGSKWPDEHSSGTFREGGGVLIALSSPTITNNYIVDNEAVDKFNLAGAGGGGIRAGDGNPTIINNVIVRNKALYGGAIVLNYTGATVKNNIVAQNTGGQDFGGAGIWINGPGASAKLIDNNTIADNAAIGNDGGGLIIQGTSATGRNNIFWGNSANTGAQLSVAQGSSVTLSYSDVQGGWPGGGNINQNPLFTDTSYYLSGASLCIDAGNPAALYNDPEDSLSPGNARLPSHGTLRNDMGAHGGAGSTIVVYVDLHLNDPRPPTSTTAHSDYQTPTSVTLQWHDPTLRNNGIALTNFKIHVYRNSTLIAVVDSGIQLFTDNGLIQHQLYHYYINAAVPNDSSLFDSASAYAGGSAQPKPPTNFSALDASNGTILAWKNPSQQIDGTALNDLAYVLIYRNGILIDSIAQTSVDTSQQRTYVDTAAGYHFFRVRVRDNESPTHFSATTDSLLGFGKTKTMYDENFEQSIGSIYRTGAWDTTQQIAYSGTHSFTDSPTGNYQMNSEANFLLPTVILGSQPVLKYHDIAIVRPGSYAMVDISVNHRKNYFVLKYYDWDAHAQWGDESADSGDWVNEVIDLSPYAGDTATIRFRLITSGQPPSDGWYIDSIFAGPANPVVTNSYSIDASWNMISLPLTVSNGKKNIVYPGATSSAFRYRGKYEAQDSLETGAGYWLKFDSAASVSITGAIIPRDTIDVNAGWNIVGAISTDIDSEIITTIPPDILRSSFYTYHGGYLSARTLTPGKSYWIKTSQTGKIILSSFLSPQQQPANAAKQHLPSSINTLTFKDSDGHTQTLLFTDDRQISLDRYDLPPLPPPDGFDIRFVSQKRLARAADKQNEIHIAFQSVHYPLTISWNIAAPMEGSSLLVNNKEHKLSSNGSVTISNPELQVALRLTGSGAPALPTEFALMQNYPNPFNPATQLQIAISNLQMVTLKIYDVLGQQVGTLVNRDLNPGIYTFSWDASTFASGTYFARMIVTDQAGKQLYQGTKRLLLLR